MDADSELVRAKWLFISGFLFLVSCCICYDEVIYLLSGREVKANVTRAYEFTRRRFGVVTGKSLTIEYTFTEPDGTHRSGSDTVGTDWEVPATGGIPVRYTPGAEGRSRLAGRVNWVGVGFFVISLGVLGFFGYRLWREASKALGPGKPKRAR